MRFLYLSSIVIILLLTTGVATAAAPLSVFVSIVPQRTFVEHIGKDLVSIEVMVQPGASPATYEPKPRQMAALNGAAIYFAVGVPFENAWLPRITDANPQMKVVHCESGIERMPMQRHEHHAENHAHHEKAHGNEDIILDPHIWLAPPLVAQMAKTIAQALTEADPAHAADYAANLRTFLALCTDLDASIREELKEVRPPQNMFMVFHPSWGYFAKTYGLKQLAIEAEGKNPSPKELQELIELARKTGVRVIFVQPQFSQKSARLVAQNIGGRVEPLDPLAADWRANLLHVATIISSAVRSD